VAKKVSKNPGRKPPAKNAGGGQNRLYMIIGAIAVVILVVVAFRTLSSGSAATAPIPTIGLEEGQQASGVAMGEQNAPVQIFEFADYQCPACASFATFAHPLIKERLVDGGVVRFVRYDFPLVMNHRHAFLASRAARCAGEQDRYWMYHDMLYARQQSWSVLRDASSSFIDIAEDAGLDRRAFSQCLRSDRYAEEVTRNMRLGESLGVGGTPTLFVNGERVNLTDYRALEELVLDRAGMTPGPEADPN
jgi:protein-disulfide isomerase